MFFCFAFLILFQFSSGSCPSGSIPFFRDESQCLYFNNSKNEYLNAETVCANLGGHLTSVNSWAKNVFLSQHAITTFTDSVTSEFWFGANAFDNSDEWTWMDNTPFEFTNWNVYEPKNTTDTICGAVIMNNGKWIADDCYKRKPFVCLVKALDTTLPPPPTTTTTPSTAPPTTTTIKTTTVKQKTCEEFWVFYNVTKSCYHKLGDQSHKNAENLCKNYGAHLVSIHGKEENLFLTNLAQSSVAYIGLWGFDGGVALKTWYDATPVDYTNWAPGYPITLGDVFGSDADIACVFLTPSGQFKQGLNCDEPRNFICKKPAA